MMKTTTDPEPRKAAFLRKIAHEMRTPLGSMLMLAELLADNAAGRLGEREIGYARKIQRAGSEIRRLLEAVLDLSRIETGAVTAHHAEVPVDELVKELWRVAGERSIELDVALADDLPTTLATDRLQLERLLGHLLDHAARAGGPVGVRLVAGGAFEIMASHGGAPIPEDQRATVFEPFQVGQRGAAALNLPIAKALAGLLEGQLELSSEGGGDTFVLSLPIAHVGARPASP